MTQTPRIKLRIDFPEGEGFTTNRPSLEAACEGNRTMGSVLGFFIYRASLQAENQKLPESEKVITISVKTEDILKFTHITEATLITYKKKLKHLTYVTSDRYSHSNTYVVNLEAIEKGIANPPKPAKRGRPTKTGEESSKCLPKVKAFNSDKSFNFDYKAALEAEQEKTLRLEEMVLTLDEKVKSFEFMLKELSNKLNSFNFQNGNESTVEEASEAKSEPSRYLIDTNRDNNTNIYTPIFDLPDSEPEMIGKWNNEKIVLYAEYRNGRRYTPKARESQIAAAKWLHSKDTTLTLEQFKLAYDMRFDAWWLENKKKLDVTDMKAKEPSSGIIRLYAMLDKIEAEKAKPNLKAINTPKASNGNKPATDIYTQASLDPERNKRNIERLKAKAAQAEQERQLKAAQ